LSLIVAMASYAASGGDVVYAINRRCLHGAPSPASAPDAALAVSQLVARLTAGDASRSAEAQLRLLEGFVLAQPALARTPHAARILVSAAVDAFGDGNAAVCSAFLRAAAFLEAYGLGGAAFLRATHGEGSGAGAGAAAAEAEAEPGFAHFGRFLDALATREGVARELQARVGCGCFKPVPRGSAAAAEQAAAAARASAESAAMPVPRGALASGDALAAHMTSVVRPLIAQAQAQAQAQARAAGGCDAAAAAPGAAASELRKCDACGGAAGLVCARCKGRRYCSRACQSADWASHKATCSAPQQQQQTS